jgi:hypothetical protein
VLDDPLFAAEGMDIPAAQEALIEIQLQAGRLEVVLSGDKILSARFWLYRLFFIFFPLYSCALPLPFVHTFILCEVRRRAYLENPSIELAESLLASWRVAIEEYVRSLKSYRFLHNIVLWLEPKAREYVLQDLFGNRSSISHIERTLEKMKDNSQCLKEEVGRRERLLVEKSAPVTEVSKETIVMKIGKSHLGPEYKRLHTFETTHGISPFRYAVIEETHGPFTHTLPHFDGVPTPHTFNLYVLRDRITGLRSMWVAVVDRYLFTKVWDPSASSHGRGGKVPFVFSGGLTAADTPYWYEPAGHLYVMRDPSYWMDIATHVDLARRQLDPHLVHMQKSSLLHLMLGACADDLRTFVRHTRRRQRNDTLSSYSLLYGVLMRTHPALYYLTFNQSVWRLPERPTLLGERWENAQHSPYELEAEVFKLSDDDLKKVMSAQALREEREREAGLID